MKGIKTTITSLILLCFLSNSFAQNEATTSLLSIDVLDVVTREPLRDYKLLFINEKDTLKMRMDSVDNIEIELDEPNQYGITIVKEGYETLSIEFDNDVDSAQIALHFFVPKLKMTKKEKQTASYHSRNLPPSIFDESRCFDKLELTRKDLMVMRFYAYNATEMSSRCDIRELRDF